LNPSQDNLMQEGLRALRSGNPVAAEAKFKELLSIGSPDGSAWFALAISQAHLGKPDEAMHSVDQALELEPRNLRALLFKASQLEQSGQVRQALVYFNGAIKISANYEMLPPDVEQGIQHARQAGERAAKKYEQYLLETLTAQGFHPTKSQRCKDSLDIMFGRKQIDLLQQKPTRHLFPGLPQREFYEREEFAWIPELEARTDDIRSELQALNPSSERFRPYVERNSNLPELNQGKNVDSMNWSACFLWRDGSVVEEVVKHCPLTMQALSNVPLCDVPQQMPSVLFSQLLPGATIEPHHGVINSRLICHLPLIVPPNCGALKVGNSRRSWEEGKVMVFDDSVRHEAWNTSDALRVVLIFDVWRPELDEEERLWISALLQAVKSYTEG
jgi:aspartyl/asparaginyl beta-hydroxylase (cupin superfamily)